MATPMNMDNARRLARIRSFARILDNAVEIPFTGYRVGLDPIIGLIPGGGDVVSLGLSGYMIYSAWKLGATRGTLGAMAANVAIDALVGVVPVVGDIFDFAFKANARNMRLLEKELDVKEILPDTEEQRARDAKGEHGGQ